MTGDEAQVFIEREREREMPGYEALTVESFVLKYRKTKANLVLPLK